jgi:hypothetical protein
VKRRGFLHLVAAVSVPFMTARAADDEGPLASGPFSFALIGEMFDASEGVAEAEHLIAGLGQSGVRFIVDVGAFKSSLERCSDQLFNERAVLLNASTVPLVAVAADNEWTGCDQAKQGGYDPYERLEALRQQIFSTSQSLGVNPMSLGRQSGMRQFRTFSENARWQLGRVLFITLDVPSPNNDYRLGAGRNGEFEDRLIANREWLERAFRYASSLRFAGIAIAIAADPDFKRPLRPPDHRSPRRDGFYELKLTLRDLAAKFHGQVILMHAAGSSGFLIDQPLSDASGKVLRNFTRIAAFAAPADKRWLEVRVDTRTPRVFSVRPRRVEDAAAPPEAPDSQARGQT